MGVGVDVIGEEMRTVVSPWTNTFLFSRINGSRNALKSSLNLQFRHSNPKSNSPSTPPLAIAMATSSPLSTTNPHPQVNILFRRLSFSSK